MSTVRLGIVMDPMEQIKVHKDSSFAMLLEAQRRGWTIHYMRLEDLFIQQGAACARQYVIRVMDQENGWFEIITELTSPLSELDLVLMRKDPPYDINYVSATWILDLAVAASVPVINPPQALRNHNEKASVCHFPELSVPHLVSCNVDTLKEFVDEHNTAIIKPLDGMGGKSIFRLVADDLNLNVILETLTAGGQRYAMLQRFIPEISSGDKRILLIDGEPVPYALARIPTQGEFRGNLATGGKGVGQPLSDRDQEICTALKDFLRTERILFAGIDVIGDYLTEINLTSPTGIRELDTQFGINICGALFDRLETII